MNGLRSGVFPIVPTPFFENGALDIESQRRVIDCMIDQGSDGLCILANFSEQFLLTDKERETLLDVCLEHAAGRIPIIVTTSHFSTEVAVERSRRAEAAGASMVMVMPPYHGALLKASDEGNYEFFERLSAAISIPIMIQDAPLSGVHLSVPLLARIANDFSNVTHFKIEVAGAADKLRALIEAGGGAIEGPFDGEESITLMADLAAGATGSMCSALLPEKIRTVVTDYLAGHHKEAAKKYERILPLINFENRQCGPRSAKTVLMEGKVIKSDFVRHPLQPLHPDVRRQLLELSEELDVMALSWGK